MSQPITPSAEADAEHHVDAASRLVGLRLDPAHRPGVVRNMRLIASMAALVLEPPLGPEDEPAPVYEPRGRRT